MITTAIDAGNPTDCSKDAAGGLIDAIYSDYSVDCADLYISDDAAGIFIATSIDSMDCADTNVLGDAIDGLIMLMC